MKLDQANMVQANFSFYIALLTQKIEDDYYGNKYAQGDEPFISAAIDETTFTSKTASKILLCYPPS